MTQEELVGKLLAAVARLEVNVGGLREEIQESKSDSCDRLTSVEHRLSRLESNFGLIKDAADKAFLEASRVNRLVHKLSCMEPDTDPECPISINDTERPPEHRNTLHSVDDVEELSSVTAAIVTAATTAAVKEARRQKSNFPIQFSTPGGWALKLTAVGAGLIGFGFAGWELLKHSGLVK
jgi:hypothetical protein